MIIDSIDIKGYRSFEHGHAAICGRLNIFVGRNNSGKSNVLNAIDAFFCFLREQAPFTLSPCVGRNIDYFNRNMDAPIEISLTFLLDASEVKEYLGSVIGKLPKAHPPKEEREERGKKKAKEPSFIAAFRGEEVPSVSDWRYLMLSISFSARPSPFGYLKDVIFMKAPGNDGGSDKDRIALLSVDSKAAQELRDQLLLADLLEEDARKIVQILSGKKKTPPDKDRSLHPNDLDEYVRAGISKTSVARLRQILNDSYSLVDFVRKLAEVPSTLEAEASKTRKNPSAGRAISSYFGNAEAVPDEVRQLVRILSKKKVLFIRETRKPLDETDAAKLFDIKSLREHDEDMRRIKQETHDILGVDIDAYLNPSAQDQKAAEIDLNRILVQANGSGFRSILRLILDMGIEKPGLLLMEEPEIHLHPALERLLLRYLKQVSRYCQVFVTTHSSNFIDIPENLNIYLLSKEESSRIQRLDYEEAVMQIPKELGIRPSSLFIHDNLVFVEGASDESILREWASTLGISFSKANAGFVHMGGVRNLGYFAADSTISFLTKRQITLWFILDKDEKDNEEISKIGRKLGGQAKLTVLERRELENYLLCPRAIADFMNARKQPTPTARGGQAVSEEEISQSLDECAAGLKEVAVCKMVAKELCAPLYFDRRWTDDIVSGTEARSRLVANIDQLLHELEDRKSTVDEKYDEFSRSIESAWDSRRMSIVPGALLLERVCKKHGVHYDKPKDGQVIASLMRKSEIEPEVRNLLEAIVGVH